jgi:predicted nicotinamide N-methyase
MTDTFGVNRREFRFGDYRISLHLPDADQVRMAWEAGGVPTAGAFPYWSKLWPASLGICEFLSRHPGIYRQKKVMELGAGLGLPSMLCAQEADSVLCTDLSEHAMRYARASVELNGLSNIVCRTHDWTMDCAGMSTDVLLLSDVNYAPESFAFIIGLLQSFLEGGTMIILSTPHRLTAREFIRQVEPWIQHRSEYMVGAEASQEPVSVYLLHRDAWLADL